MEKEKKSSRGGARTGAGRPKGSGNKVTAQDLLDAAQQVVGKPFVISLMEGYAQSIDENNNKIRVIYERMVLDKIVADRQQVEVVDNDDALESRRLAFAEALAQIAVRKDNDKANS